MIQINICGDFKCNSVESVRFSDSLLTLFSHSQINCLNLEAPIRCEGCAPIEKDGPNIEQDKNVPTFLKKWALML